MNSSIQNQASPLSANGRFGRLSYLGWNMLLGILILIFGIILAIFAPSVSASSSNFIIFGSIILLILIYIAVFYFSFIFAIRRLHDKNQSGWLTLLMLLPLVNLFFFIYLACAKGDEGSNNYGSPRTTQTWEKILAWIYIIIFPISILLSVIIGIPAYQSYIERVQQIQIEQNINYSE
ncbi:DUF805 domain-containing protein [Acinetobacter sp. ANC 4648]|uniref:DUF805 domain-containing protein n=1 Tax=Acinetobacter sp. ANC 4648 TaxID=1977875 RepID=UPI000A32C67C|nr:DUF805 domain-containing protein [Acinetobacter sp. ANC 4648]OTG84968.1 hypothetical protein B9T27_01745 [Acinetobacter sp. ANC 4648]